MDIVEQIEKQSKKEYSQQYFRDNKQYFYDAHKAYRQRTMQCECGCTIKCYNQALHKRSEKHQQLMKFREMQARLREIEKK